MKKVVLMLFIAALVTGGAFAQQQISMSAGAGFTFTGNSTKFNYTDKQKAVMKLADIPDNISDASFVGIGFFGFFDATYAMAALGMTFLDVTLVNKDERKAMKDAKIKNSLNFFDISLYGKYPIDLNGFTLFPMLGVNFKICTDMISKSDGYKLSMPDPGKWYSSTWLKFGVGGDIALAENLYLRPIFLYGFGSLNKMQKDSMTEANKDNSYDFDAIKSIVNHGFDLSVAVGYKF